MKKYIIDFLEDNLYNEHGYKSIHKTECDELIEYIKLLERDNKMYSQLKDTNEEELREEIEENCKLSELWKQSQNEVKRLNNTIDKAIEYIRQYDGHISGYYYSKEAKRFLVEENVKTDLLDILKGNKKD